MAPAIFLVIALLVSAASAADPDPLQDICVANLNSTLTINGFACKPSDQLTSTDFVSRILRRGPATALNAFIPTPLFVQTFPGLNTAGVGLLRVDLGPQGLNSAHFHPRATELAFVDEGKVLMGFVDGNNKVFMETLEKGDVFIIPRGAVHFQLNVGYGPATFFSFFNSQSPGLSRLSSTLFTSSIPDLVLQKSFQLSKDDVTKLRKALSA